MKSVKMKKNQKKRIRVKWIGYIKNRLLYILSGTQKEKF